MPLIVYVPFGESDRHFAESLVPEGFELQAVYAGSPELHAAMPEADYLIGLGDASMDDAFYARAPKLRLVQLLSAGYDKCDIESARRAGVPICNNGGANAVAVAEHTLLLMLAVCRRLVWQHQNVAAGRWRGNDWQQKHVYELEGKTLGIIGLGTIGRKVARMARGFGMNVIYFDIVRLGEAEEDVIGARFRLFDEVLAQSDIVSLHVPLLDSTRHMISNRELALMQAHGYLINTSRGPVVDEPALAAALSNGAIAGAGLDVFDSEPPPADNPLFTLENVVLTAHLAGPPGRTGPSASATPSTTCCGCIADRQRTRLSQNCSSDGYPPKTGQSCSLGLSCGGRRRRGLDAGDGPQPIPVNRLRTGPSQSATNSLVSLMKITQGQGPDRRRSGPCP